MNDLTKNMQHGSYIIFYYNFFFIYIHKHLSYYEEINKETIEKEH